MMNEKIVTDELTIDNLTSKLEKSIIKEYDRELFYVHF